MVKPVWIWLAAAIASPVAHAQSVDWSGGGGGLFFETPAPPSAPEAARPPGPALQAPPPPFDEAIAEAADRNGLDPKLLHALVAVESAYRPTAVSLAGAVGLTQLMPATADELGVVDRLDPADNISGGARYLAAQMRRFGDVRLALAAYNAGPERVAKLGRIPKIPETQDYVIRVIECYLALSAGRSVRSAGDCQNADVPR